jgi:hypothetical protein
MRVCRLLDLLWRSTFAMRVASELVALDLQLLGVRIAKRVELRVLEIRRTFGLRRLGGRLGVVVALRPHLERE